MHASFVGLADRIVDHPGMKIEASVRGAKPERRDNMRERLGGLAVTVESPGKRILAVNVFADRVLSCCEFHSLLMLDVVVRVVVDQHAIVEDLIEYVEAGDEFNQVAL